MSPLARGPRSRVPVGPCDEPPDVQSCILGVQKYRPCDAAPDAETCILGVQEYRPCDAPPGGFQSRRVVAPTARRTKVWLGGPLPPGGRKLWYESSKALLMVRVRFLELMPRGPRRRWHRALRRAATSSCYQGRRHRKRRSWDRCIPGAPWRRRRESIPVPLDENFERAADGMNYLPCSGPNSSDALLRWSKLHAA